MTASDTKQTLETITPKGSPIFFLQPDQTLSPHPRDHSVVPVVRVSIRPALLADHLTADPERKPVDALALIDTGADYLLIDQAFADQHGFQSNSATTVRSSNGSREQKKYPGLFKLSDGSHQVTHAATLTSVPLRENGHNFDVILGMQFLSNGILVMDFDSNTFRFEFTTKPNK